MAGPRRHGDDRDLDTRARRCRAQAYVLGAAHATLTVLAVLGRRFLHRALTTPDAELALMREELLVGGQITPPSRSTAAGSQTFGEPGGQDDASAMICLPRGAAASP